MMVNSKRNNKYLIGNFNFEYFSTNKIKNLDSRFLHLYRTECLFEELFFGRQNFGPVSDILNFPFGLAEGHFSVLVSCVLVNLQRLSKGVRKTILTKSTAKP